MRRELEGVVRVQVDKSATITPACSRMKMSRPKSSTGDQFNPRGPYLLRPKGRVSAFKRRKLYRRHKCWTLLDKNVVRTDT